MQLLHAGATGNTAARLAHALGIGDGDLDQLDRHRSLLSQTAGADEGVRLMSAVSLWANHSLRLKSDFLAAAQAMDAELLQVELDDMSACVAINNWVQARTSGQIDHLIDPGDIAPGTPLLILTALYFKGRWGQPFDPSLTREGSFKLPDGTVQRVPMMHRTGPFSYGEFEHCRALELPFGSGRLCMRVLLPVMPWASDDQAMSDLLELPGLQERLGEVALPRSRVDVSTDLVEALTAVGVGVLFSPDAEFGGISDNGIWVSRVKQRTTVTLDEEGAEAAAAMSIHFIRSFVPPDFTFVVDRPFYWTISDTEADRLLLVGFVANPSEVGPRM
jgi:serine protease inhibitor